MRPTRPLVCAGSIAAFVLTLASTSPSTRAADLYWDGSASNSWNALENWTTDPDVAIADPLAVPGASDLAIFNFTGSTPANQIGTLGANQSIRGIVFGANATVPLTIGTLNDFTLTLGSSGLTAQAGSGAHIINSAITIGASQTWTSNGTGVLTTAGAVNLGGDLTLAGTSGFAFSNGTLQVSGNNRTINIDTTAPVNFGNIDTNDGTSRALTLNVAAGANPAVNGVISDTGAIIKSGPGTLTLNGANTLNNVNTGLTVRDGKVVVTANNSNNPRLNMGGVAAATPILELNAVYRVENIVFNASGNPNGAVIQGTGSFSLNANRTITVGDSTNAAHDLTINVPLTNGDSTGRSITRTGAGTLVMGAAHSFSGNLQLEGGTTIYNVGNVNTGGSTVFNNATGTTPTTLTVSNGVQYRLPGNMQVNANAANGVVVNGEGTIGIHGGERAFIVNDTAAQDDLVISIPIAQSTADATARGIRKEQTGTLVIQGANTYTGVTDIARGTMVLDYSVSNGDNKLSNVSNTQLRGGTLILSGNSTAPTIESIGAGQFRQPSGPSTVSLLSNNGQALTFDINDISRGIGEGLIDFRTNDTNLAVYTTTEANSSFGFLGAYATFNGDRWAANNGSGQLTAFTGGVIQNDRSQWQTGGHLIVDGALTGALSTSRIGSLIFDAPVENTLSLDNAARALTIESGGILVSADVGANNTTITGGQLIVPGVPGVRSLLVTNRSTGVLTINANIGGTDTPLTTFGSSAQEVTFGGTGEIVLAGRNSHTGDTNIHTTVRLLGGNAIPDFAGVVLATGGNAQLDLNGGAEGIGSLSGSTSGNIGNSAVNLGTGGRLTINQVSATTYAGQIIGSGTIVKNGSATLTISGTSTAYSGEMQILGGTLDLTGDHDGILNVDSILIRGGQIRSLQDYGSSRNKIANTATVRLEGTIGNGLRVSSNQNASRTEEIAVLDLGAGANTITVGNTASSPTAALTTLSFSHATDAFTRSNNATLLVRGDALGAAAGTRRTSVRFTSGIGDYGVGTGTVAGSKNLKILPFAAGSISSTGIGDTFVTVDAATGLRPLDTATEYATNYATAGTTDNLSLTSTGTSLATATFNALRIDNSAGNVDLTGAGGGSNTLTLTSGALLVSAGANANSTVISGYDKILAGTNGAANDELVVRITSSHATPAGAVLRINSPIGNHGAGGGVTHLTKTGDGTLILEGNNSYGGETTINDGVLEFGALANLGGSTHIRNAGGTLRWGAGNTADITSGATVELLGPSVYLTPSSGSILSAGAVFDVGANNVTLANAIGNNGSGGLTKVGAGTLTLSTAPNYTGTTVVSEGALNFQTIAPNTTRALYILSNSGAVSSTVENGLSVDSLVVGGVYSGTTSGTGTLTVNAGPVQIGNGSGDDLLYIGVRPALAGAAAAGNHLAGKADFRNASSVSIDVSEITLGFFNSGQANNTLTAKGELLLPASASAVNTITASSIVLGNAPVGVINANSPSLLDLGGGQTTMNVDTLVIAGRKSAASVIIAPGGTFKLRGAGGENTTADVFLAENDNGTSSTNTEAVGILDLTGATADLKINKLNLGRLSFTSQAGSGTGTLTFDTGTVDANTIRMGDANFNPGTSPTNHAKTTGILNQNGGTLRFADLSKGSGTAVFNWSAGTIGNLPGTNLTNQNVAVSLNTSAPHSFDVSAGQIATFESAASFTGAGGFTKTGLGTLKLNGNNDYAGDTIVNSGALIVDGTIATSAVTVNAGTLGGSGSIANEVNVGDGTGSADVTLAPGFNGIGMLTTGPLSLNSDAVFALEINISAATLVTSDLITSTGPLTLNSPALVVSNLGNNTLLTAGTVIPFLSYTGPWNGGLFSVGGTVISDFDGVANSTFTVGANTFAIDYDNDGTAALVVVPEPSTAVIALAGIGALLGRRRFRRSC